MGQIINIQIDSIFDGIMPSSNFGGKGQYLSGIGIDPDIPATDSATDLKTAGIIRPVNYVAFSGAAVDSAPIAIITNPKNTLTYVILANGKLVSYDSSLGSETTVGTVSGGVARGGFYYNNYIYIIKPTNVSRYGPLDGTPALTNDVWTGATLGSQTALTDTSYPTTLLSIGYLNHFGITHLDNRAYFLDYAAGVGYVHYIKTKKTTNEGDTNDNSAYGFLDLPFNFIPLTISSYGNDLVVSGTYTTSTTVNQGQAALFFFNPADTTPSFYRVVKLPDTICTILTYDNGVLYGISGEIAGGYRLWRYVGGDSVETLKIVEDGYPPMQGAHASVANRLVWGANTSVPMISSGLYAYGSKSDLFPRGLHHIALSGFTS
jgi:hypothetical protein